ncbi:MAG: hypothetical protein SGPRY_007858 [Prymnesium sp.]
MARVLPSEIWRPLLASRDIVKLLSAQSASTVNQSRVSSASSSLLHPSSTGLAIREAVPKAASMLVYLSTF